MQKQIEWSSQLGIYRVVAFIVGGLIVAAFAFNAWMAAGGQQQFINGTTVIIITLVACALPLAALWAGFLSMRDAIKRTASTHDQMLDAVNRDALTGAYTRAYFLSAFKDALKQIDTTPVGFVHVDMDHLKQLNDANGHAIGDIALAHLVSSIRAVMDDAIVGRLGGDEFGIVVPGCGNSGALKGLCTQVHQKLREPFMVKGRLLQISATMGLAVAPRDADTVDDLISKADLALYHGKKQGRNIAVAFEGGMLSDVRHKRNIERELRAALLTDELELYYQPIVDAQNGALLSYEALVRWIHPVRGVISPCEFIPVAESGDLIHRLGEWVLGRACDELGALNAPRVSINVSPIQLRRDDFADRFQSIVQERGIDFCRLTVEVTESVPLSQGGKEMANLHKLRQLGVKIAIDDFGAGHASLACLKLFSFSVLKIDRSYIQGIGESKFDSMLVASICRIARAANMDIVAEGVETEDQARILRRLGCTALQGYHLGRPTPLRLLKRGACGKSGLRKVA